MAARVISLVVVLVAMLVAFVGFAYLLSKTRTIFREFRRQEALVLRLPARPTDQRKARFHQWAARMRRPVFVLSRLNIVFFTLCLLGGTLWGLMASLIVLQLIASALGTLFVHLVLSRTLRET